MRGEAKRWSEGFHTSGDGPLLGIAYSDYVPSLLSHHPDTFDYVEVPFELLHHNPNAIALPFFKPLVLHCASLSIAGTVPPNKAMVESIQQWVQRTRSPWLGEHLAFVTARQEADGPGEEGLPPLDVGYAVNGPTNAESLNQVLASVHACERWLGVPLLLENPPVYFTPPGSTMTQVEFIQELCARSSTGLLLDLCHLYISSQALGFDARQALLQLPMERVVEVHVSGASCHDGVFWDDHTTRAPDEVFELLALVLERSSVRAVTLEYNWSVRFPLSVLLDEAARVHELLARRGART